jgi:hypothetical protein
MDVKRETRSADSPFVERIKRVTYIGDVRDVTRPDGTWDLIFRLRRGRVAILHTGQIVRPIDLAYEQGDSYFSIAFKPDVYMPHRPGSMMFHKGIFRPLAGKDAFWLDNDRLEIPTFDNAERFVAQLASRGLIARDRVVRYAVEGNLKHLDDRTLQRHFARVTGMTGKTLQQILRANRAVDLIERGCRAADVASDLGYTDQSHLTNSLRRILGRTPGEIARTPRSPESGN